MSCLSIIIIVVMDDGLMDWFYFYWMGVYFWSELFCYIILTLTNFKLADILSFVYYVCIY